VESAIVHAVRTAAAAGAIARRLARHSTSSSIVPREQRPVHVEE
jgi:hypothetical protein